MLISVCMIVKNEQDLIAGVVENAQHLADEVIIVDTGSTDNTIQIARKAGAVVFIGEDAMHKAQERNRAAEDSAGDWIVILDADERIAEPAAVRRFLETTDAQCAFIKLAFMDGDKITLSYNQMRIWRRGTFEYKYRAHEVPIPINGWGKIAYTDFVWEHRPPSDRTWKKQYTLDRLLLDVEENPNDSRPLYYLGRQYMYMEKWADSITYLKKYLDNPGRDTADAWNCISICCDKLGNEKDQIEALYRACADQPERREWWCALASIYHRKGKETIAVGLLKYALEQPKPENMYVKYYWYGSAIHDLLARCLWKLKRYEEGREYAVKALELEPDNTRLKKNLLWFDSATGDNVVGEPMLHSWRRT